MFKTARVARAALSLAALALFVSACTQVSAQSSTPTPAPTSAACTISTTISKPTGLALTANPASHSSIGKGILLTWNAPPASDDVRFYKIYGRIAPDETELSLWFDIDGTFATTPITELFDDTVEDGKTYVYRIVAIRWDNCYGFQESTRSDSVSLTYSGGV